MNVIIVCSLGSVGWPKNLLAKIQTPNLDIAHRLELAAITLIWDCGSVYKSSSAYSSEYT